MLQAVTRFVLFRPVLDENNTIQYNNTMYCLGTHLVLFCPVLDGASVPWVRGAAAGLARAPALLLQPRGAVRVDLGAHAERAADRQVAVGRLKNNKNVIIIFFK